MSQTMGYPVLVRWADNIKVCCIIFRASCNILDQLSVYRLKGAGFPVKNLRCYDD